MQLYRLLRNMQTVFAIFLVKCRKMWREGADKNPEWVPPPARVPRLGEPEGEPGQAEAPTQDFYLHL